MDRRLARYRCGNCDMKYWSHFSILKCPHCGGFLYVEVPSVTPAQGSGTLSDAATMLSPDANLEEEVSRGIAQFEELLRGFDGNQNT